jgi:hypothetical protein|nr:MAG TPA: hypothetical protein [Caudoviricetes sp.]
MKILATIKELSEKFKVPIKLVAKPDGTIEIYIDNEKVNYITVNSSTDEDFVCSCLRECVEIYFRR